MYCRILNWMSTDVSEVPAASIITAMSDHLCTRRRENLKSHMVSSGSAQSSVASLCEHGNEPSGSLNEGGVLTSCRTELVGLF
jgi:hypothetical protein